MAHPREGSVKDSVVKHVFIAVTEARTQRLTSYSQISIHCRKQIRHKLLAVLWNLPLLMVLRCIGSPILNFKKTFRICTQSNVCPQHCECVTKESLSICRLQPLAPPTG